VAAVQFSVNGFSLSAANPVANRVVVVHDSSGVRVACGVLESTPGLVVQLAPHDNALADAVLPRNASGLLVVGNTQAGVYVVGTLANLQPNSTGALYVHEGCSCAVAAAVGGRYEPSNLAYDPWANVTYSTNNEGTAQVRRTDPRARASGREKKRARAPLKKNAPRSRAL
jgi:hypothetical protein